MNVFIRTASGFGNYSLFTGAEFIIYCEGGSASLLEGEVDGGAYNACAEDVTFWRTVIDKSAPGKTIKIKPLGSKSAVVSYAKTILNRGDKKVIFVLDRDWDDISGKWINDSRVIYTIGYSWENDVFFPGMIPMIIGSIGHLSAFDENRINADFLIKFNRLQCILRRSLYLQLVSYGSGVSFVPTNETCDGVIHFDDKNGELKLSYSPLISRIKKEKGKFKLLNREITDVHLKESRFPGHVLMGFCIRYIKWYVMQHERSIRLNSSQIKDSALTIFRHTSSHRNNEIIDYYQEKFKTAFYYSIL
ncbi:DUF4435 domain-containing protein [Niveispirillum sp. KHB5.9]|uniref:DUF4435 domain-containing protein n=1 Tax=Niveispirillum sp. KHB5.9 TaxID=3400269 RepID=UPI003A83888F